MTRQDWAVAVALALALAMGVPGSSTLTAGVVPRHARSTVPALEDVAAIQYVVRISGDTPQCTLTVTDGFTLGNTVARLKQIDWKQKGTNLENARIRQPEIEMTLIEKKGRKHRYAFYWQVDSFIDFASNRMLQTDCSGFRADVVRALVLHCAKERDGEKKEVASAAPLDGTWKWIGYRNVAGPGDTEGEMTPAPKGQITLRQITGSHSTQFVADPATRKVMRCQVATFTREGDRIRVAAQYATGTLPDDGAPQAPHDGPYHAQVSADRLVLTRMLPRPPTHTDRVYFQTIWERAK